jgi:hypothetical protein
LKDDPACLKPREAGGTHGSDIVRVLQQLDLNRMVEMDFLPFADLGRYDFGAY